MHRSMAAFGPITATDRIVGRVERQYGCVGRCHGLVAQQDRSGDGGPAGEGPFGRVVHRLLGFVGGAFVGPGAVGEHEEVTHQAVDLGLVDLAAVDGGNELVAVDPHRARHLEVEPGVGGAGRIVDAVPVGDDEAVEAPLVAQDLGEQSAVVGAELAVEAVVGAHDPPGVGLLHGALERAQVELAQCALVDVHVDAHALDLGVVGGEVLDGDGDVVRLHATDVGRQRACRSVRGPRCSTRRCGRRPVCDAG